MRRQVLSFRGEAPRVTPRGLPDNAAQAAVNASLFTGDLRSYRQFAPELGLANPGTVRTIYKLVDQWLSWEADVDVARGTVAGDTTYRTYLTGPDIYSEPRFTNYALATTGAQPYPVTTRPLGVPAPESAPTLTVGIDPTPTSFSVDVLDDGGELTNWVVTDDAGGSITEVGSGYAVYASGGFAEMLRNFGIASASIVHFSTNFEYPIGAANISQVYVGVMVDQNKYGVGIGRQYITSPLVLYISGPGGISALATGSNMTLSTNTVYTLTVDIIVNADDTRKVTASLYQGSVLLEVLTATNFFTLGDYVLFGARNALTAPLPEVVYSQILVQATGSTNYVAQNTATSYVYTFVNDLDQESAPSLPSATTLRPDGVSVTVSTPVAIPSGMSADYGINKKRIYRAATGNLGTVFRFVAEIDLTTADYIDELTDSELGETLQSEMWVLPPADLKGILALPNGIMAGFSKNQLCLSAQNYPHAWPVEYRLNTDTDIVGLGNIDTTVVIGTESFVYIASGNDPAAYSMSKFEVPYACVSKRSFAYLTGIGVVFAGPDGLMAVTGPGQVRNLTDPVFTREQWQALNPSSIRGVAHNDVSWMFWESGSLRGCYALDMKQTGAGVIQMAFHASAAYVDPIEDKMYLVLDEDNEPDDVLLPVPADPPAHIDGRTIFEFEGNPAVRMNYRWRSKLWLLEHPAWLSVFQVKAEDYDNILLRIYGDGVQIEELVVEDETEFIVTQTDLYTTLEVEVLGSSPVRVIQGAEDVKELD